jgi:hypothetical protein
MTVRAKSQLSTSLASANVKALLVSSNVSGEFQLQVGDGVGGVVSIFIPSSVGQPKPRYVNLLEHAPALEWRKSKSLMAAVRGGHLSVLLKKK